MPSGPRAYRARIRTRGPLVALGPPAVLGVVGWLMLHDSESGGRGVAGFVSAVFAAPLLLVAGAPLRSWDGLYLLAIAASVVLWILVGVVASRRATRAPIATWREYWTEWSWLAAGVWGGVLVALVASNLVLGRAFL